MQNVYQSPIVIIGTIVLAAITLVVLFIFQRRHAGNKYKPSKKELDRILNEQKSRAAAPAENPEIVAQSPTGQVNARVYDAATRSFGFRWINRLPDKDYGRQWDFGNIHGFSVFKDLYGQITPVVPSIDLHHSPAELYEAINTEEDIATTIAPQKADNSKIKIGLLVFAAVVALFLMFLAARG